MSWCLFYYYFYVSKCELVVEVPRVCRCLLSELGKVVCWWLFFGKPVTSYQSYVVASWNWNSYVSSKQLMSTFKLFFSVYFEIVLINTHLCGTSCYFMHFSFVLIRFICVAKHIRWLLLTYCVPENGWYAFGHIRAELVRSEQCDV